MGLNCIDFDGKIAGELDVLLVLELDCVEVVFVLVVALVADLEVLVELTALAAFVVATLLAAVFWATAA